MHVQNAHKRQPLLEQQDPRVIGCKHQLSHGDERRLLFMLAMQKPDIFRDTTRRKIRSIEPANGNCSQ